jgi:hypothetical protein
MDKIQKETIPEIYYPDISKYPNPSDFKFAIEIPKGKIRAEYRRLIQDCERYFAEDRENFNEILCWRLMKYYEVFPNGLLRESEYHHLAELYAQR